MYIYITFASKYISSSITNFLNTLKQLLNIHFNFR